MTISRRGHLAALAFTFFAGACIRQGLAEVHREAQPTSQSRAPAAPGPETPTEVAYIQLYSTPDGETHFRGVNVPLMNIASAPPAQPFAQSALQPATTIRHVVFQPHWGAYDRDHDIFHAASERRFISFRRGETWIKASDGETRHFQPGDVLEVLDVAPSKGHITWVGDEPSIALFSNHP